jgi:diguanylate cyclase (GGDEF)-like protein
MRPYPVSTDEAKRLAALHATEILDSLPEPSFDAIVTLASRYFGCPIALVSLLAETRQWFKARTGIGALETARNLAFCNHTIMTPDVFVVNDARADSRFSDNPLVLNDPNVRFYAGYPLTLDGISRLGSLCVIDTAPRAFTDADKAALSEFGHVVEALIQAHTLARSLAAASDASQRKSKELEASNGLLAQAERMAGMGAWAVDLKTMNLTWSDQLYELHDLPKGSPPSLADSIAFYTGATRQTVTDSFNDTLETGRPFSIEADFLTATGRKRRARASGEMETIDGVPSRITGVFQDITSAYEAQTALWHTANIDFLTGLDNRSRFQAVLTGQLDEARAKGSRVSLMLLDLDGFKEINDTLGHQAGDDVLRAVASRLLALVPAKGSVARLGGDEFAVILPHGSQWRSRMATARRMMHSLAAPVLATGESILVAGTGGIATFPEDAGSSEELLRRADIALYNGKRHQRGAVGSYVPEISNLFDRRRLAIEKVERAIIGNRLLPYYQPFVRLSDRKVYGYEALARIRNLDGSVSAAADFSEAFSDPRSCRRISERMLNLVTADIASLRSGGINPGIVSLNASEAELNSEGFPDRLLTRLGKCLIDATSLKLEVTETLLLGSDSRTVRRNLQALSDAGVLIALDDFGTGYSSLTHLRDFPIHQIKIDKSFVFGLGANAESPAIVKAIVDLAHTLELSVVAEGIETEGQFDFLRAIGCDSGQGFLFGRAREIGTIVGNRIPMAMAI